MQIIGDVEFTMILVWFPNS